MTHDADRQARLLRQVLVADRRPIALLLGAGCPMAIRDGNDPLIPDVDGLTERIRKSAHETDLKDTFSRAETQVGAPCNVEQLLTHVRALRAVAGDDEIRGFTPAQLDGLEGLICGEIFEATNKSLPEGETPYHRLAAWCGYVERMDPVELFTPNYDVLVEEALEELRVPYFDGFVGTLEPFFDLRAIEYNEVSSRWARLWKVHGSINWSIGSDGVVTRTRPDGPSSAPVIYPSHLKYDQSRRMPYLALLDRLRAFVGRPRAVVVTCGYSFRDEHLNEVLSGGAASNPSTAIFGLQFGSLSDYPVAERIAKIRPNLSLLASDRAVIGSVAADWTSQDEAPVVSDQLAVAWTKQDGRQTPSFKLGDFDAFGHFLADVVGRSAVEDDAPAAEAEAAP